jgi:hypothetical protein
VLVLSTYCSGPGSPMPPGAALKLTYWTSSAAAVPPSDMRDAPDPFILDEGARYLLDSTQVALHNVPVATSPDLRHWSPPSDALRNCRLAE